MNVENRASSDHSETPNFTEVWLGVHGSALTGYDEYCPITYLKGYDHSDGKTVVPYNHIANVVPANKLFRGRLPGFLILQLGGDFVSEDPAVDTAAQALFQSLQLLFIACQNFPVHFEKIRTYIELSHLMQCKANLYTHVIVIGHASTSGIRLLDRDGYIGGAELGRAIAPEGISGFEVISLCCYSGHECIAQGLSARTGVQSVIASADKFDLRWTANFVTSYFMHHFLYGLTRDEAVHAACMANVKNSPMAIWEQGEIRNQISGEIGIGGD